MGATAVTWGDAVPAAAAHYVDLQSMRLLARDHRVLTLVARFGQLTTPQLDSLVFYDSTTRHPCDKAIKRLVKHELLEPVAQRHPGGRLGGSSVNVYQLGREGWPLFFEGRRKFARIIRAHSLSIADVFVAVKEAECAGWLDVLEWSSEPDTWLQVAGADLRPDLYLDLGLREKRERRVIWCEVDLGGERQKQIVEKIERYTYAYQHAHDYPTDVFPEITFLATDPERVKELRQIISRMSDVPDGLITVASLDSFPQSLR